MLGPLKIEDGPRALTLARGKECALLAVLLLSPNEPVSTDQLVEELWGVRRPGNATKTVQIYVSRLRKILGAGRLITTASGYAVRVEPGELDSQTFEQLARDGHEKLMAGDAAGAERLLSNALALWRGPALVDFRFDAFAQAEIRRLDELRNATEADRIDARLDRGEADSTIAELKTLVEMHPLWENVGAS